MLESSTFFVAGKMGRAVVNRRVETGTMALMFKKEADILKLEERSAAGRQIGQMGGFKWGNRRY
jgi:hypothetical protein